MSGLKIGVIGATGMVGRQYLEILEQSPLDIGELRLYASARSVGSRMTFAGESLPVQELTVEACRGLDVALFSVSTELARQYAPRVAANGTLVIDDSSAFRMDPDVPLVVPEVNPEAARARKAAMDELIDHSRRYLDGERPAPENHPQSLAFNIFPHIDGFRDDGYTKEEWKMLVETRKIMGLPDLKLSATCVRVPVAIGHSEALHIEFDRPMTAR